MHCIHHIWLFVLLWFFTSTQYDLHKDLCSLELKQSLCRAACSIKTALLEVTKGLCWAGLIASSFLQYSSQTADCWQAGYALEVYPTLWIATNAETFPITRALGFNLSRVRTFFLPVFMQKHLNWHCIPWFMLLLLWSQLLHLNCSDMELKVRRFRLTWLMFHHTTKLPKALTQLRQVTTSQDQCHFTIVPCCQFIRYSTYQFLS